MDKGGGRGGEEEEGEEEEEGTKQKDGGGEGQAMKTITHQRGCGGKIQQICIFFEKPRSC